MKYKFIALFLAVTLLFTTTAAATGSGGAADSNAASSRSSPYLIDYQSQGLASLGAYFVNGKPDYACFVVNNTVNETRPAELYQWSSASGGAGYVSTYVGSSGRKYVQYCIETSVDDFCTSGLLIDISSLMGSSTSFDVYFPEYSDTGGIYFDGVADWTSAGYTYFTTRSVNNNSWYAYSEILDAGDTFNSYSTLLDGVKPFSCDINSVSTVTIDGHRFIKYSLTLKADQSPRQVVQFVIAGTAAALSDSYDSSFFSIDLLNNIYIDLDSSVVPDGEGPPDDGTGSGGGGESGGDQDTTGQLTDIKDAVTELPNSIAGKIADAVMGLFVPDEEQLESIHASMDTFFSDQLGAVWTVMDFFLDLLMYALDADAQESIAFPGIVLDVGSDASFILEPADVYIWPNGFRQLQPLVRSGVTMVLILCWFRGLMRIKDRWLSR